MTPLIAEERSTSLLDELDALVDESIDAMSPKELKEFKKERKKIMAEVELRASGSAAPLKTAPDGKQALGA